MQADNFGRVIWARAVVLQLVLLGLWWTVLYQPSLVLLRITAQIPFALFTARQEKSPIAVDADGQWNFSIPVGTVVRDSKDGKGPVSVGAIEFAAPDGNVESFATAWFVYLGLALNAPFTRANLRRTLIGLGIQTIVSGIALLCYAEINVRGIVLNMYRTPDPFSVWLTKVAYHIDYLVVPYASPFLILLGTHPAWWTFLTTGEPPATIRMETAANSARK